MNKKLIKYNKQEPCSFLNCLEQTAVNNYVEYPLVPRDYYSIDVSLKDAEQYRKEIEKQLKHSNLYLKTRKFFKEKVFGRRVKSIDELFDLQLNNMRCINHGLDIINNEARQRLGFLEKYIERVNHEFETNFLGIDCKKDSLNPLLQEYLGLDQKFTSLTKNDNDYFNTEKSLRKLKRQLSEGGLSYKKMLDAVDDLEKEKGSLGALEDFFRYSIHLSERMIEKARRFENHVANTKDTYIMAKNINCGFAAVLKVIQNSGSTISQLQHVLTEGLSNMGNAVSDSSLSPYQEFEVLLRSRYNAVRNQVNQSDQNKEMIVDMEKLR